jgi:two-component system NtrC family sensor kinase
MKKLKYIYLTILYFLFCAGMVRAQQVTNFNINDSLKKYRQAYAAEKSDLNLVNMYDMESSYYRRINSDSCLFYAHLALNAANKSKNKLLEALALSDVEYILREKGDLAEALNIQFQSLEIARQQKSQFGLAYELNSIGNTYLDMGDPQTALRYYRESYAMHLKSSGPYFYWTMNEQSNIGNAYEKLHKADSALYYELKMYHDSHFPFDIEPELLGRVGNAYTALGKYKVALRYYRKGLVDAVTAKAPADGMLIDLQVAMLFNKMNNADSSIYYARKAYVNAKTLSFRGTELDASRLLADLYASKSNIDSAYYYQHLAINYNDTLFGAVKFNKIQHVLSEEQQRQQKLLQEREDLKNRYQLIGGAAIVLFVLIVAVLIWRNNLSQRKKNKQLDVQKTQLTEQRDKLQSTLLELKATQSQLIQSEKMASLGELTAGIAHEIQNPLNFVNNFSEVNKEMVDELEEELKAGNIQEALAIAADIKANEEKINHHGKRADFIVKGMLQHSRTSTGEKQLTNINVLADEFLKLSYHGLRAKDKNFNAELITNFDDKLPKVNIASQEIGRVLLNLFNNAFYAVNQKQKNSDADYKPEVAVSTSAEKNNLIIKVKDNGNGISDAIKDKIMQPFFTTKPTGEGTGLGLSLSYDIVVKGHGGKIDINSTEGEGSEFTISIPIQQSIL